MDNRTRRVITALEDYLEYPPPGVPEQLIETVTEAKDLLTAPVYSDESPGERSAREVAEEAMSEESLKAFRSEGELVGF